MEDWEVDLLAELHFVSDFETLANVVALSEAELELYLKQLIEKGFIDALVYDDESGDYVRVSDNFTSLERYHFVATKKGLLAMYRGNF